MEKKDKIVRYAYTAGDIDYYVCEGYLYCSKPGYALRAVETAKLTMFEKLKLWFKKKYQNYIIIGNIK